MLSVALDIARVIQASQKKHSETDIPSSFAHHDLHQIRGLVLTLHNAILFTQHVPAHRISRLWKFKKSQVDARVELGSAAEPGNTSPGGKQ
ncbi:hypothetical protein BTO32_15535 [Marinobacter lutaoensis]|uniref:Uncharacterized protein n=1 Tax=Marinobacter lutaoensis TaxID=135739 RepID=A0A1V2DPQ2_9GAMM|nr:hypothetical protein [Marinobacter lutaoensis]ONF42615.1 hypothetical protein BTO32_15535 [Marinobacter lutaoensis]